MDTPGLRKRSARPVKNNSIVADEAAPPIAPAVTNGPAGDVAPWYLSTTFAVAFAVVQRIIIFFWGLYQDATMTPRFTDIDYFVFTDAARFMHLGGSPYDRETYRYTPLLAWLLLPTAHEAGFFSFGKVLFAVGDIVAGILILRILKIRQVSEANAVIYSAVWLLNPMVSTISTRGSSEGLLGAMVISFVWAVYTRRLVLGGVLAGVAVHFKIYPIIYIPTVIWSLASPEKPTKATKKNPRPARKTLVQKAIGFINRDRIVFAGTAAVSFLLLTGLMYLKYGYPFLLHTYLHHLSRIDHRHNFSPYSTLLYISSSPAVTASTSSAAPVTNPFLHFITSFIPEPSKWAFFPQLFLSGFLIPVLFAKRDVTKTMFLQTFAFVTFNKVCTAQYFMWYMVLLPFYLPSIVANIGPRGKVLGVLGVIAWQAATADEIFSRFHAYDWASDDDFKTGLQRIRANLPPQSGAAPAEADLEAIELKAKTFFYEKKFGVRIDQAEYLAWAARQANANAKGDNNDAATTGDGDNGETKAESDPPYSLKYHEIVELILNNKPIPGIKHIPDTVLGLEASTQSTRTHRCKPWEKQSEETPDTTADASLAEQTPL
ncbi:hypothetical protein DV454_001883 [Geotrichum candidum]|nr:hypothetical protein DV454_001883 [Geotrichum candidum]